MCWVFTLFDYGVGKPLLQSHQLSPSITFKGWRGSMDFGCHSHQLRNLFGYLVLAICTSQKRQFNPENRGNSLVYIWFRKLLHVGAQFNLDFVRPLGVLCNQRNEISTTHFRARDAILLKL
jgi:hypothetical protein